SMIKNGWEVAITHGNGPQVGFILRRSELAARELHQIPLDVAGADTQGAIGYALQQNLYNDFHRLGMDKQAVTGVTQTEVVADAEGNLQGVAAVIDKDLASSLLATALGAELFMISTAVEKVALNYGKPNQEWVDQLTLAQAKGFLAEGGHFAGGSMAPKIQAVVWYLERGGREAIVTNPDNVERALAGETGTRFTRD